MKIILIVLLLSLSAFAEDTLLRTQGIQVIGHQESSSLVDFIPSVTKLEGKELQKKRQTSLGDTLQGEAGVSSTTFGPSASRPVIRGMDGDRIRVLQNSLGTMDASTQSLDHAIPVDTLTLESIEIVRGPMSLLYGSSAVGGVVNLVTNRIHSHVDEGVHADFMTQAETVNSGVSSGVLLNYGKDKWMYHVDGSTRNLQDQKIPGYSGASPKENKGTLANSANQQDNVAAGVSRIFDKGYLGVSFNHFNTNYGTVAEKDVTIDMFQNRFELHGEYNPQGATFRKLKIKSAQSNYVHRELEDHLTGTVFKNTGNETRLEAVNAKGAINGISGVQSQIFHFSAKGDEAFLPTVNNQKYALFTYQELKAEKQTFSLGGRGEASQIKSNSENKDFFSMNGSVGHLYKMNDVHSLSSSFSFTERAPNFQELYSDGPHLATGTFESGTKSLNKEKAYAFEVSFKRDTGDYKVLANLYSQIFNDYIYLAPTGQVDSPSGLDKFDYRQDGALFYGADLESKSKIAELKKGMLHFIGKFDIVRAKNTSSGDNLPRISPPRLTAGLEFAKDKWSTDAEVQHVLRQSYIAANESRTDAYTLTNIGYSYNFYGHENALSLFARVRNIFDVEARNHISTLKNIAPLPGRNLILGLTIQI